MLSILWDLGHSTAATTTTTNVIKIKIITSIHLGRNSIFSHT
jgi:hypothetical protein